MIKNTPTPGKGIILAVDDDRMTLKLLTTVLAAEGYEVHGAISGELALESVTAAPPELILLDIVLPDIDGFEVCRRLKAHADTRRIPVIFLSAATDTKDRVTGFKLGAVDFVPKPFQREELLARVQTHMALARLQAELKRESAELGQANLRLQAEISARNEMATSLAESEEKFRTLAGSAQDAFVMLDDQDRIIFWNRAATSIFGYTEQEISGVKFHERMVPERLHAAYREGFTLFTTKGDGPVNGKVIEMTTLRRNGTEFPIELSVAAVHLREKRVIIAVIRDITSRLRSQEILLRSEDRLNLALEAARMGTWELDLVAGTIWRSRLHDHIFGYDAPLADWSLEVFFKHVVPEDREMIQCKIANPSETGVVQSECRILRASDGELRWINLEGKIYRDEQNKAVRMMGIVVDITEEKQAEQERQLSEAQSSLSQKLESVGRLASGVAHEINTPMQFITDNTQFLKRSMTSLIDVLAAYRAVNGSVAAGQKPDEALALARTAEETNELEYLLGEIPRTFDETMSGLQRVTHIIKSLKEFSHPNTTAKSPADLNKAINTTIAVSRHEWKYVAEIVTELDPDLPMIPVCIDEMNQVMLNLIVNAAHAIGDALKQRGEAKGVITLRTKQEGNSVLVEVQDNGTGIPESAQSHIFEPFFTTKGVGKGTGQGLAIIRTIVVKNHGGTISFTTAPGKGTVFHIHLPMLIPEVTAVADIARP